jgi:hypothetical protein
MRIVIIFLLTSLVSHLSALEEDEVAIAPRPKVGSAKTSRSKMKDSRENSNRPKVIQRDGKVKPIVTPGQGKSDQENKTAQSDPEVEDSQEKPQVTEN